MRTIDCIIHALNDGDQDKSVKFCGQYLQVVNQGELDIERALLSDEAIFRVNDCINRHICVQWASENPKVAIHAHVNIPDICVWCAILSEGIVGPFFLDGIVTAKNYLPVLQQQLFPLLQQQNSEESL